MPGTLRRGTSSRGRSDSESSQDSRKQVSFSRNVRVKPIGEKYSSNGSGVTRVDLNRSSGQARRLVESRSPSPRLRRLDDDILVNRFGRVENENEIEYVMPKVNNRYVMAGYDGSDERESASVGLQRNGGDLSSAKAEPRLQPDTPPGVRRNHVWNIVNQFDRESKQKYVCQNSDDDDDLFGSDQHPDGISDCPSEMSKSKKNPITNGIKVIFGLKSSRKSEEGPRNKVSDSSTKERVRKENEKNTRLNTTSSEDISSKKHVDRLGLLKTATENRRKERNPSAMSSRAFSPDHDATDGYSTSKTFEYYDNKDMDEFDKIRDYYLNKYRDPYDSRIGSPAFSDYRDENDNKPPTPPRNPSMFRSTGNISSQKSRLENGASEYVFKSSEGIRQSREAEMARKRDLYKSTGDLEYRSRPFHADNYGGSHPDLNKKTGVGYSDDDRSPSPRYSGVDRSGRYISTVIEDERDRRFGYRDDSIEREGEPISRNVYTPDSRYDSMSRMRRAPSYESKPPRDSGRGYDTPGSERRPEPKLNRDDQRSPRAFSPDDRSIRKSKFGSTSSINSVNDKHDRLRSWERRGMERRSRDRGRIPRYLSPTDEPTYSTIDKRSKVNRKLDYKTDSRYSKEKSEMIGSQSHSDLRYKSDKKSESRVELSKKDGGHDTTGRYGKIVEQEDVHRKEDRSRALQRVQKVHKDRSSSPENFDRHVERSHQKHVIKDEDGYDQTIEEENYNNVTMEKVDTDSDTEEVVDVTTDQKTEEYEKDGHYHKNHRQSKKETKTFTYNRPDVVEHLRSVSKPVNGAKRISDRPYDEELYGGSDRQLNPYRKPNSDFGDVKTSIEKSSTENRYREGNRDIMDNKAVNRAVVETGTIDRQYVRDGHKDTVVRDHNDYTRKIDHRVTVDDSDPTRKLKTKATVDKVDHYRTIDERQIVERLEKKPPSLERSRQQLKQLESGDKYAKTTKGKKAIALSDKEARDSLKKETKNVDAVYTKVKKTSKSSNIGGVKKWHDDRSSDDEPNAKGKNDNYGSYEDIREYNVGSRENGRYRDLTKVKRGDGQLKTSEKHITKLYHEPLEANIEKANTNGWVTRKKEVYVAGDSSSPSPPLQKKTTTSERSKTKTKLFGSKKDQIEREGSGKKSIIKDKEDTTFHHYKQYKGKHGPNYPSIRITLPGKENSASTEALNTSRSSKYQRGKIPSSLHSRNGSVDRLEVPSPNGYHSSTLQHSKKNKNAIKRSSSTAASLPPPVQRLRNNRGISPLRTKNHTSSSADSVAGESTTSSKRAVGFYIPGVKNGHKKSMEELSAKNSTLGVSRTHSMLSSKSGGLKKFREKTTTYAMAQPQGDQVDKEDEIYGSTTIIDYSKIDEEDEVEKKNAKNNKQLQKKLKRTTSLPKDTRFPWLFRRKKKEKMRVVNE